MKSRPLKFVISGGGTGGHIFPAIAIAEAIKAREADADLLFIGAHGRMEMEKVPKAGYRIKGLWISGFQRKMTVGNLLFPFKLGVSLLQAYAILKRYKPDVVIGVGGYASGPTLKMAVQLKIPSLIQEQNSFPGVTNRLLANKVSKICVAYDKMNQWFPEEKTMLTGNPIRQQAVEVIGKKSEASRFFGLNIEQKTMLIVGGSQGALAINEAILKDVDLLGNQPFQLIWQTGKSFYNQAKASVEGHGFSHKIIVTAFIDRMDLAYALADLIISRAGAMSISEICVLGKASILVPLPSAAEDHQTSNARRLESKKAAVLIKNEEAVSKLVSTGIQLLANEERLKSMAEEAKKLSLPNAGKLIADEIFKLVRL